MAWSPSTSTVLPPGHASTTEFLKGLPQVKRLKLHTDNNDHQTILMPLLSSWRPLQHSSFEDQKTTTKLFSKVSSLRGCSQSDQRSRENNIFTTSRAQWTARAPRDALRAGLAQRPGLLGQTHLRSHLWCDAHFLTIFQIEAFIFILNTFMRKTND